MDEKQKKLVRDIMYGDVNDEESYYRRRYYSEEELVRAQRIRKINMIFTIIFIIVAAVVYIFTYKSKVIDPIEDLKKTIIIMHLGLMIILLFASLIINILSKDINTYLIKTYLVLAVSIIVFLAFSGVKYYMNTTYTKEKFEQLYDEKYSDISIDMSLLDMVDLDNMKIKTEKEFFADECSKVFKYYNIKTYGLLVVNLGLIALFAYQTNKISELKKKKDRIAKDDIVLFDEEENVKI